MENRLKENYPLVMWDEQIRLFARYFLAHARLPLVPFSLLDAGCGTGSALYEIRKCYPHAIVAGCDLEYKHVHISTERNGKYAHIYRADIMELQNHYDIIYISNVIEHIKEWKNAILHLLKCCDRLYILVPFLEDIREVVISNIPIDNHVSSFDIKSFDFLRNYNYKAKIRIIRTPHAWGYPLQREIALRFKSMISRKKFIPQRELLIAISCHDGNIILPENPFQGLFRSWYNFLCALHL
jgi:SAM-dependent methyltransferase